MQNKIVSFVSSRVWIVNNFRGDQLITVHNPNTLRVRAILDDGSQKIICQQIKTQTESKTKHKQAFTWITTQFCP